MGTAGGSGTTPSRRRVEARAQITAVPDTFVHAHDTRQTITLGLTHVLCTRPVPRPPWSGRQRGEQSRRRLLMSSACTEG